MKYSPEARLHCRRCNAFVVPVRDWVIFKNWTVHLEGRCPRCMKLIRYLPQEKPWLDDGIEPRPVRLQE